MNEVKVGHLMDEECTVIKSCNKDVTPLMESCTGNPGKGSIHSSCFFVIVPGKRI
jgi:hypothetical protein